MVPAGRPGRAGGRVPGGRRRTCGTLLAAIEHVRRAGGGSTPSGPSSPSSAATATCRPAPSPCPTPASCTLHAVLASPDGSTAACATAGRASDADALGRRRWPAACEPPSSARPDEPLSVRRRAARAPVRCFTDRGDRSPGPQRRRPLGRQALLPRGAPPGRLRAVPRWSRPDRVPAGSREAGHLSVRCIRAREPGDYSSERVGLQHAGVHGAGEERRRPRPSAGASPRIRGADRSPRVRPSTHRRTTPPSGSIPSGSSSKRSPPRPRLNAPGAAAATSTLDCDDRVPRRRRAGRSRAAHGARRRGAARRRRRRVRPAVGRRRCSTWRRPRPSGSTSARRRAGPRCSQDEINALLVERGRRRARRSCGSRAATRSCSPAAARRRPRSPPPASPSRSCPASRRRIAVPAYAGIPVTLRYSSTSFTVVTGHEDPATGDAAIGRLGGGGPGRRHDRRSSWAWPARPAIAERLMAGGLAPDTPVAAVQWGTRPEQRTVAGDARHARGRSAGRPVGDRRRRGGRAGPRWFERRPLFGRRVVVTRARAQASTLSRQLARAGRRADRGAGDRDRRPRPTAARRCAGAVARLATYDWVVLTSPNGVHRLFAGIADTRALAGVAGRRHRPGHRRRAVALPACVADLVPERFVAESLLEAFPAPPSGRPGRVLLARAAVARDVLPDGLRAQGWEVDVVEAYRTRAGGAHASAAGGGRPAPTRSRSRRRRRSTTSSPPSASTPCRRSSPASGRSPPTTARRHGLTVTVEADVHTIDGLVDAVLACLATVTAPSGQRRGDRHAVFDGQGHRRALRDVGQPVALLVVERSDESQPAVDVAAGASGGVGQTWRRSLRGASPSGPHTSAASSPCRHRGPTAAGRTARARLPRHHRWAARRPRRA